MRDLVLVAFCVAMSVLIVAAAYTAHSRHKEISSCYETMKAKPSAEIISICGAMK